MIDRSLMSSVLSALDVADLVGLRESNLCNEIALAASRHIEASEVREHLAEAKRNGWIESTRGPLGETRWRILEAGRAILRDLRV